MRHIGAGLAVPDFPRMLGRWLPPAEGLTDPRVAVHLAHRAGALIVLVLVARLVVAAERTRERRLALPPRLALALVIVQIALGATTVLSGKAVLPTTAHVATGAAILGLVWFSTLRAHRHLRARDAADAIAVPLGDPALS
jgi:heme A synthase